MKNFAIYSYSVKHLCNLFIIYFGNLSTFICYYWY